MQVDRALISKLEHLARLELTEEEAQQLVVDLNQILGMVGKLEELDTSEVEPLIYINEAINVLRPDEIVSDTTTEQALQNAPEHDGAFFQVPKVIE